MLGGGAEEDLLAAEGASDTGTQVLGKPDTASDSEDTSEVPEWLKEGEYVVVGTNKMGTVRYIGPTDFQEGTWVGVELDLPSGEWAVGSPTTAVSLLLSHLGMFPR
jgi:kinesin family protein 13